MENNGKVIDFNMNIMSLKELANYLQKKILKKYAKEIYFFIEEVNDEYIQGIIDGARFVINYEPGKSMLLEMNQGFPKSKDRLVKALEPVMWYIDKDANNPLGFRRPLLNYKTNDSSEVIEWNVFNPVERMNAVAHYYFVGQEDDIYDLEVYYPETTLETLKENIKYGSFTGLLDNKVVEGAKNFTEVELYIHIKAVLDLYEKYVEASELLEVDVEDKLDMTAYLLCYLMQQTKRFNVPCNPPADEPIEPTAEQLAWIRWWSQKLADISDKTPEKFEEWKDFPLKIDPNYKPDGDYRDLLGEIKEECPLFENDQ